MKRVLGEILCGCLNSFIAKQISYRITQKPSANVAMQNNESEDAIEMVNFRYIANIRVSKTFPSDVR
jgi:hypothetical protein